MFIVKNLSILLDSKYLVKELSFSLNKGDKIAIIGEEGNGKSTLLKVLLQTCSYVEIKGTIFKNCTIGYLKQFLDEVELKQTVKDYLFLDESFYYESIGLFSQLKKEFQLNDEILEQTMDCLSGGERIKVGVLRLFLMNYDVLFLDEPTNDLDLSSILWLENVLKKMTKPILFVSHDETCIRHIANKILHLEQLKKKQECRHILFVGNYDDYISNRTELIAKQNQVAIFENKEHKKKEEKLQQILQKVEYQQNTVSRSDPHTAQLLKKKMHSVKSQEKRLNKETITEKMDVEEQVFFSFPTIELPIRKMILDLDIPTLKVNDRVLSHSIHMSVYGPSHIVITGKNGIGKSTLLRMIYQELSKRNDLNVGYMPQNYEEVFEQFKTPIDFLCDGKNIEEIAKVRSYLGNMNFTREEMVGDIKNLSGGTKAKLFLMKFILYKCNVLILDEPTRNVSPLTNPVISKTLKEYGGCILCVSHDRSFIDSVGKFVYEMDKDGLKRVLI